LKNLKLEDCCRLVFLRAGRNNLMDIKVLYEDNHLIAVEKPAGILVQGDESDDPNLMDQVKEYIKEKYQKPGNVFLGLIHRLDRNVSGIVLFAKTSKGASRLSEQFRVHSVEKIYHAWLEGAPEQKSAVLKNYLVKDERNNKTKVYDIEVKDSLFAELSYELIESRDAHSLLKIKLKTGRPHQIRAQLAYIGHPVVGDVKYGAKKVLPDEELLLRATELSFNLATGEERKTISIEIPELK
jgi:23S rRNA pseudouridine1911/1915/1917 synthase